MRPNMDAEIVVLQAVLANAKDEHQLKAGLAHAIELLEENVPYAAELAVCLRRQPRRSLSHQRQMQPVRFRTGNGVRLPRRLPIKRL
jgi:hypothetical protein